LCLNINRYLDVTSNDNRIEFYLKRSGFFRIFDIWHKAKSVLEYFQCKAQFGRRSMFLYHFSFRIPEIFGKFTTLKKIPIMMKIMFLSKGSKGKRFESDVLLSKTSEFENIKDQKLIKYEDLVVYKKKPEEEETVSLYQLESLEALHEQVFQDHNPELLNHVFCSILISQINTHVQNIEEKEKLMDQVSLACKEFKSFKLQSELSLVLQEVLKLQNLPLSRSAIE
jgi:hypothetical protein